MRDIAKLGAIKDQILIRYGRMQSN